MRYCIDVIWVLKNSESGSVSGVFDGVFEGEL